MSGLRIPTEQFRRRTPTRPCIASSEEANEELSRSLSPILYKAHQLCSSSRIYPYIYKPFPMSGSNLGIILASSTRIRMRMSSLQAWPKAFQMVCEQLENAVVSAFETSHQVCEKQGACRTFLLRMDLDEMKSASTDGEQHEHLGSLW